LPRRAKPDKIPAEYLTGRAAYVSAAMLEGHNDPGAEAVARVFEHLAAGWTAWK